MIDNATFLLPLTYWEGIPKERRNKMKTKMCKFCKEREATEGNKCFMCWEELNYLMAEAIKEFN
jgi:hypothetical protein